LAQSIIKHNSAIFTDIKAGNLTVNYGTAGSDLDLSLTLTPGIYAVTIICKFYNYGDNTAYVTVSANCNPSVGGITTNQGSSVGGAQIPMQYTVYIAVTEQTVIKPYVTVGGSNAVFFDNRSIQAIKLI
jgi:hypothetical protein